MSITLNTYIVRVNEEIERISNGNIGLGDLVDFESGSASISECHAESIHPRVCAARIFTANGMGALVSDLFPDDDGDIDAMNYLMGY